MELIDAKKCLQPHHITDFTKDVSESEVIAVIISLENDDFYKEFTVNNFYEVFTDEEVKSKIQKSTIINFVLAETALVITGNDYLWWTTSTRKLNKLFTTSSNQEVKVKVKKETKKETKLHNVAIGIYEEQLNSVVEVRLFSGSEKEIKDFLNKEYAKNQLKYYFQSITMIAIDYSEEKDLEDISSWKTVEQLVEEGILVV